MTYVCPNGHEFPTAVAVPCEECGASVACVPVAKAAEDFRAMEEFERLLREGVLLSELWRRSTDPEVRRMGADLLQVLDPDGKALTVDVIAGGLRNLFGRIGYDVDDASLQRAARAVIREIGQV